LFREANLTIIPVQVAFRDVLGDGRRHFVVDRFAGRDRTP
jgi:hypothetical protein